MALVRFLKEYLATTPQNDAPRADWQEQHKTGPIGHWYPGQLADLHEDEVQHVLDGGYAELVERDGGEFKVSRPLWTEAEVGQEWGSEEQATTEDVPVTKKVASAQEVPVTATRKYEVPGIANTATVDPAASVQKDPELSGSKPAKTAAPAKKAPSAKTQDPRK